MSSSSSSAPAVPEAGEGKVLEQLQSFSNSKTVIADFQKKGPWAWDKASFVDVVAAVREVVVLVFIYCCDSLSHDHYCKSLLFDKYDKCVTVDLTDHSETTQLKW